MASFPGTSGEQEGSKHWKTYNEPHWTKLLIPKPHLCGCRKLKSCELGRKSESTAVLQPAALQPATCAAPLAKLCTRCSAAQRGVPSEGPHLPLNMPAACFASAACFTLWSESAPARNDYIFECHMRRQPLRHTPVNFLLAGKGKTQIYVSSMYKSCMLKAQSLETHMYRQTPGLMTY